jgi:drug/metabolite transporter (DMT)-like permease
VTVESSYPDLQLQYPVPTLATYDTRLAMASSPSSVSFEDWIKGIGLSVLASIIGGASKLAIRKSWLLEQSHDHVHDSFNNDDDSVHSESLQQVVHSSYWHWHYATPPALALAKCLRFTGMIGMTVFNPLCCVLAMNYASPSILAPFSGLTLVWIVLFSHTVIGERPTKMQVVAASLIVLGEVVVAIFGDHTNDEGVTVHDVSQSYQKPGVLLYFAALVVWMVIMAYWIRSGESFARRFAWGVSGGSITGLQNFLKDSLTIFKSGEPMPWFLPLLMLSAVASAFGGLLLLTACMKRYDATYSSAMFVGSFVVSASIMSAIHYETFDNLETVWNYILYPVGITILMAGVWILVHAPTAIEPRRVSLVDGLLHDDV